MAVHKSKSGVDAPATTASAAAAAAATATAATAATDNASRTSAPQRKHRYVYRVCDIHMKGSPSCAPPSAPALTLVRPCATPTVDLDSE